ncbi:HNH endonuclease [Kocuria sp.]|uniref:HNH endonuclease n=1 Tax=Kocuria sp. TaxID=1871328 RepID=UPI0034CEA6A6
MTARRSSRWVAPAWSATSPVTFRRGLTLVRRPARKTEIVRVRWSQLPYRRRRSILLALLVRDDYVCCICGLKITELSDATVEHKQAQSKGGTHDTWNLGPAHATCNYSRGNRDVTSKVVHGASFFRGAGATATPRPVSIHSPDH